MSLENEKETLTKIKERTQAILGNLRAEGTKEDPLVFVNINFTESSGPFTITFKDFYSYIGTDKTGHSTISGDPSAFGATKTQGNTQENQINIALSNKLIVLQSNMPSIRISDTKNSFEIISRSLAHELGHTAGLYHPWDSHNNIPEINNDKGLPPTNQTGLIKNNLLNSEVNPIPSLRSNFGTELIKEQREKIKETVESQQPAKTSASNYNQPYYPSK